MREQNSQEVVDDVAYWLNSIRPYSKLIIRHSNSVKLGQRVLGPNSNPAWT